MSYNPNVPDFDNIAYDDLQKMKENFQILANIATSREDILSLAVEAGDILDSRIVEHNLNILSPSNGYYIRWGNGLQVCWRREIVGGVQDFPSTFNDLDDRPFPAVFAELTGIQATVGVGSSLAEIKGAFYIVCIGTYLDRWSHLCIVRHANAAGTTQSVHVNLLAIGRWK